MCLYCSDGGSGMITGHWAHWAEQGWCVAGKLPALLWPLAWTSLRHLVQGPESQSLWDVGGGVWEAERRV